LDSFEGWNFDKSWVVWWAKTTAFWDSFRIAIEGFHSQNSSREKGMCKGPIGFVLSYRGSGGFEGARDAISISLSSIEFGTKTKEGFCSGLVSIFIFLFCKYFCIFIL
jgi:hypothetical protein